MVRRCAVVDCYSSDISILSHRFPRNEAKAEEWKISLGIKNVPLKDLINKYCVCSLHFIKSDYRNEVSSFLNSTAIPRIINNFSSDQRTSSGSFTERRSLIESDSDPIIELTDDDKEKGIDLEGNFNQQEEKLDLDSSPPPPKIRKTYHSQSQLRDVKIDKKKFIAVVEEDESWTSIEDEFEEEDKSSNDETEQSIVDENKEEEEDQESAEPEPDEDPDFDEQEYRNVTRKELILQIIESNKKIQELEIKLGSIKKLLNNAF